MRFTPLFLLCSGVSAWELVFYGEHKQQVHASGTKDVKCNNLRSDFTENTFDILFWAETDWYPDPSQFTAYEGVDCKGGSFTGVPGDNRLPKPRRMKSYKLS